MSAQTKLVGVILAKNIILIGLKDYREVNSMAIKIDMEMPKSCSDCKYKEGGYTDERYTCKLLNITFPAEYLDRFALCPLQEVKE